MTQERSDLQGAATTPPGRNGQQGTVLLIDDDTSLLAGLRRALMTQPFKIVTASSVVEALHALDVADVDVVVCDQQMPDATGTETLARLRDRDPLLIRIMLTGNATLDVAMRAINEGEVFRFLVKPCRPDELAMAIRQAIQHRQLIQGTRELLTRVRRQQVTIDAMRQRDSENSVDDAEAGVIVVDDAPTDLDALLREVVAEIDAPRLTDTNQLDRL